MADFDTNDVVRLGCVMKFDGLYDIVNVLHVQITAGGGLAFAQATLDFQQYTDALYDTIDQLQSQLVTDDRISIANRTQNTVFGAIAWDAYVGGTLAQDPTPLQVALLAFGRTSVSRVQIRKYLGVFCEPNMTVGLWDAAARAAADAFMVYHVAGQTMDEGLVLRGCAYRHVTPRVVFAQSVSTSQVPVIQRRRRVGRGS